MIKGKRVLGLVPARGGSKGLPGKNLRLMCGKPLIGWTIEQGMASKYIDRLVVSSDSTEIAKIALKHGAEVPYLRPPELASDTASSASVILHALDYLACQEDFYDLIVLLEPTSPLRDVSDIDGAIELCVQHGDGASVVGVTCVENAHPAFLFQVANGVLRPINGQQPSGLRRQDLTGKYYYLEGSIYVSHVGIFEQEKSFYHSNTLPWFVDRNKAIEIDELSDFIVAEALMSAKIRGILL